MKKPLVGLRWAWLSFWLVAVGAVTATVPVAIGLASVLYTFYPPMIGNAFYYISVVFVVVGSWAWVALMLVNLGFVEARESRQDRALAHVRHRRGDGGGRGHRSAVPDSARRARLQEHDRCRSRPRVLLVDRCTPSFYFWLMSAYIAYYTIILRASCTADSMARISFILFLAVSMPIGIHHLFADPPVGSDFKFMHSVFTTLVAVPTMLTVFTICASVEIAVRLRGGRGPFGWIRALPWSNPMMLAVAFSFVMLGFGGAIVIMYFVIAYDLWPHLTGRALMDVKLMRWQLWLWFIGMIALTFPWQWSDCRACRDSWCFTITTIPPSPNRPCS